MTAEPRITPPHEPTFNVRLSNKTINSIAKSVYPDLILDKIEVLTSGQSFNNRIYFLDFSSGASSPKPSIGQGPVDYQRQVLKVTGSNFEIQKVQNEVACLLLLEKYCPTIAVPRVLAWNDSNESIRVLQRQDDGPPQGIHVANHPVVKEDVTRGWALLSRLPGRTLTLQDLETDTEHSLMIQLAQINSHLRESIRFVNEIGNLQLENPESPQGTIRSYKLFTGISSFEIGPVLLADSMPPKPLRSAAMYHQYMIENESKHLVELDVFRPNRPSVSLLIEDLIVEILPRLQTSTNPPALVFTHFDFSPRNVLVSTTAPITVTGLVDFEFAGIFPETEDFVNDAVDNDGDWPAASYHAYLEEMERSGEATPLRGFDSQIWKESVLLRKITDAIAPWQIRVGSVAGNELAKSLHSARMEVERAVSELKALVNNGEVVV